MYFYQHFPEYINPIVFSIGDFNVRWYSLAYLMGFLIVYGLLMYRIKRGECKIIENRNKKLKDFKDQNSYQEKKYCKELIIDFLMYSFAGLIIGARLGYVLFYNPNYFINDILAVISPFDSNGNFTGIYGMSYFGGLIGIIFTSLIFAKRNKINFLAWADFVIPAIPAGYFFGRIGNFLNGELYGKITTRPWGMYFSENDFLRHPTQLYEAFLEGILLFAVLWSLRNKFNLNGRLLGIYLFGYGLIRFFIEFIRNQEFSQIFGLNKGQIWSLVIIIGAAMIYLKRNGIENFSHE